MSDWETVGPVSSASEWEDVGPVQKEKVTKGPPVTAAERVTAGAAGANRFGVAGILGLPVDMVESVINLFIAGKQADPTIKIPGGGPAAAVANMVSGSIEGKFKPGGPEMLKGSVGSSEWIASKMKELGFETENPRPDDAASRALYLGTGVATSAMLPNKSGTLGMARSTAAQKAATQAPEAVTTLGMAKPAVASGAGAVAASETLGEDWAGVGSMVPAAAGATAAGAKRKMAETVAPNIDAFKTVGAQPSLGQAFGDTTTGKFLQGMENLASKFPGGAGVMRAFGEKMQKDIGAQTKTGVSAEEAGQAIQSGVDDFKVRTKETWKKLDAEVGAKIAAAEKSRNFDRAEGYEDNPPAFRSTAANAVKALDELTTPVPTAEASTGAPLDARIVKIKQDLQKDLEASGGQMTYEGLRAIRSRVGDQLDDSFIQGARSGEMDKLYGALSDDLKALAKSAGQEKAFDKQNAYYRARMARLDGALSQVVGTDKTPEHMFTRLIPKNVDEFTRFTTTMKSLPPEDRRVVTDALINRMSRAKKGQQNEYSDVSSTETFLSNWADLHPKAKAAILPDGEMRANMEAVASISAKLRDGAKIYANPSGTAGSLTALSVYGAPAAIAGALGSGNAPLAASIAASTLIGVGGNYAITTKMLTNKKVLDWVAKAPKVKPQNVPAHLAKLATIYNESDDESLKEELQRYIDSLNAQQ